MGQLVVTPEVVACKINNMKENKSPGVDGISPKILKETVEQISMPLAHMFNMSLQEGIVPLEWKEANSVPLLKKQITNTTRKGGKITHTNKNLIKEINRISRGSQSILSNHTKQCQKVMQKTRMVGGKFGDMQKHDCTWRYEKIEWDELYCR